MTEEKIESLNRHIASKEIELITEKLQQRKAQAQMILLLNSTKHLMFGMFYQTVPTNSLQTLPKNRRGRKTSQVIL